MNRQRSDSVKSEQEKAEGQQTQPPSMSINQPIQSKPSTDDPTARNEQDQHSLQKTPEHKQSPPAWLLPTLLISFMTIVIMAAILSLIAKNVYVMLVVLVMPFMLVYIIVRYYFPSKEGIMPQLFIFILKLFGRQT